MKFLGQDITNATIRTFKHGMSHIWRNRHKHGLVLDYTGTESGAAALLAAAV